MRQTTSSGHVVNLGGLGDFFGFFGYDKDRTANGYDYVMGMNLANGNIGIGTRDPSDKLEVHGKISIPNGGGFRLSGHDTYAKIQSYSSRPLSLNPEGNNVGINTTSPDTKLDIAGLAGIPVSSGTNTEAILRVSAEASGGAGEVLDFGTTATGASTSYA